MVYIVLCRDFEETEAVAPCDILRRGGVETVFAATGAERAVTGAHGITIMADRLLSETAPGPGDFIVIPGGVGVSALRGDAKTIENIRAAAARGARPAAICAGPAVLADLGLLDGVKITCYPGCEPTMAGADCDASFPVREDKGIITGRSPGAAVLFGLALLEAAAGKEAAQRVREDLICP